MELFSIKIRCTFQLVSTALVQADGNRETAAGLLGISRTTLYSRMKEYGIMQKKKGK